MRSLFYKKMLCVFCVSCIASVSFAQDSAQAINNIPPGDMQVKQIPAGKNFAGEKAFKTWSIGVHAGALAPAVAIGGSNDFTKWKPTLGYGIYIKHQFFHAFGLQAEFIKGTLEATNEDKLGNGDVTSNPYKSFKTDLNWSANLSGVLTLANINWLYNKYYILPYITAGAGIANYNPVLEQSDGKERNYKPSGNINELIIPVGIGMRATLGSGINLDIGYQMNFLDGDNLDGYYNSPGKDKYGYAHAGLEFALGAKEKPQLATHNPAAQLSRDLMDQNEALKAQVSATLQENEKAMQDKLAMINALNGTIDKLKADADGDGVSDYFDKCANTAKGIKVDGAGCPLPKPDTVKHETKIEITEEDRRIVKEAFTDLQFDFGKATIRSSSYPSLDKLANILVTKNFSLKLAGHTDNVGSESANLKLSKDRAESVKAYLVSKGANASRIEATGYGETQPIATNKTDKGRQQNRRVEFTLY